MSKTASEPEHAHIMSHCEDGIYINGQCANYYTMAAPLQFIIILIVVSNEKCLFFINYKHCLSHFL